MGNSKLYTAQDIEVLKQKITSYRDTLNALKTGSSIDGYLFIKNEFNDFKSQISHLGGQAEIMNDKQSAQIEGYEQQVKQFSVQINSLNQTVKELNQDISLIINKIGNDSRNDFIEPINALVDAQDNSKELVGNFIKETIQPKDQTSISSFQQSNRPPSFKQLQYLVTKANEIQESPSDATPIASHDIQKKYPGEQQYSNKVFPSTDINPSQLYNGRSRNISITSAIHPNKFVIRKGTPIRVSENPALSLSLATSVSEKNEQVVENSDEVNELAPIEDENTPIEISDEVNELAPIEGENTPIEISDEVNELAPIEDENIPVEISNEMKRQQHKNKENFWLFNLFSKKH